MPTLTPNLSLVKPAGTESADVAVINSNYDIIDLLVATIAGVQALSNKTLTAPHLVTPVVDSGGMNVASGDLTVTTGALDVVAGGAGINAAPVAGVDLAIANPGKIMTNAGQVGIKFSVLASVASGSIGNRLFSTYDVGPGFVFIFTQSVCAMYQVDVGTVTLLFGSTSLWGTVSGVGTVTNVYWNGGNSRVELTNNTAGSLNYYVVAVGL